MQSYAEKKGNEKKGNEINFTLVRFPAELPVYVVVSILLWPGIGF